MVSGGSRHLEGFDGCGDAALAGAEFFDAFGCENDDGMLWVLVLLQSKGSLGSRVLVSMPPEIGDRDSGAFISARDLVLSHLALGECEPLLDAWSPKKQQRKRTTRRGVGRGSSSDPAGGAEELSWSPERALRVWRPVLRCVADVVAELASLASPAPPSGGIARGGRVAAYPAERKRQSERRSTT
jgi:hypothetical protein